MSLLDKIESDYPAEMDKKKFDEYWIMMCQRQEIWYRRFVLKLPKEKWYEGLDPVFKEYKFTNVYRTMDRNTVYLTNNVMKGKSTTEKDVLFNILLFRVFNKIETYEKIGFTKVEDFDYDRIAKILDDIKKSGQPIFTSAYMINGTLLPEIHDKHYKFLTSVKMMHDKIDEIYDVVKNKTPQDMMNKFMEFPGIAEFTAYEFYCDIANSGITKYNENDFLNIGPGCFNGLRYIFPGIKKKNCIPVIIKMKENANKEFERLNLDFRKFNGKDLTLRCVEHWMCEMGKYFRYKSGGWRPRVKFKETSSNNLYD